MMSLGSTPTKRQQVIDEITEHIRRGILSPGDRLATVRNMSAHFDVSLSVVQNALHELTENGVVECRGASGFYVSPQVAPRGADSATSTGDSGIAGRIILNACHHSDLVWRYPFSTYEAIRDAQMTHLLALAHRHHQFHFSVEQAEIIRVYLRAHPELREECRELLCTGRLEILGGFCIPDLNLISGESIMRNLLLGRGLYEELLGKVPVVACMNDAFGMCAQFPQIAKLCGYSYLLPGRLPNSGALMRQGPFRWVGLDGTDIITAQSTADMTHLGHEFNVPVIRDSLSQLAHCVSALNYLPVNEDALVHYVTEEGEIQEDVFDLLESARRSLGRTVEFGSNLTYFKGLPAGCLPRYQGEFNPVFTGCYTTRLDIKQAIRKAENRLFSAEFLQLLGLDSGGDLKAGWETLLLCQFHDAMAGCHTDEAHQDIMQRLSGVLAGCEAVVPSPSPDSFSVCNVNQQAGGQLIASSWCPQGLACQEDCGLYYFVADLPPCGCRVFRKASESEAQPGKRIAGPVFATDFFRVDFRQPAPVIINAMGDNVFAAKGFGEILMRADYGTMWTENLMTGYSGAEAQEEQLVDLQEGPVFFKAVTEGRVLPATPECGNLGNHWPGFESLAFRKEYIFPKHLDYFKLRLSLEWRGCNTKISIRFPLALKGHRLTGTYEVPFGCVVRKPYFEVQEEYEQTLGKLSSEADYEQAKGDWPALNWVNYSDAHNGLTVANTGTPGHQLANGDIIVSVLRSGTGIRDGRMVPQPGSYDNGRHDYEFAFCVHGADHLERACQLGMVLNRPPMSIPALLPEGALVRWEGENVQFSCLRRIGKGLLLRLYEAIGRESEITLRWGRCSMRVFQATPNGARQSELHGCIHFSPFQIRTFYCLPVS